VSRLGRLPVAVGSNVRSVEFQPRTHLFPVDGVSSKYPLNSTDTASGQIARANNKAGLPYVDKTGRVARTLGFPGKRLQEPYAILAAILLRRHSCDHLLDSLPSGSRHETTHLDRQRLQGQSRDVSERRAVAMER
jgi:hypothetical protein